MKAPQGGHPGHGSRARHGARRCPAGAAAAGAESNPSPGPHRLNSDRSPSCVALDPGLETARRVKGKLGPHFREGRWCRWRALHTRTQAGSWGEPGEDVGTFYSTSPFGQTPPTHAELVLNCFRHRNLQTAGAEPPWEGPVPAGAEGAEPEVATPTCPVPRAALRRVGQWVCCLGRWTGLQLTVPGGG